MFFPSPVHFRLLPSSLPTQLYALFSSLFKINKTETQKNKINKTKKDNKNKTKQTRPKSKIPSKPK